jgi:hypothetical protein
MKNSMKWFLCAAGILWGAMCGRAAEGERLFHLENRLHMGYDDNVTQQSGTNEIDSVVIREDLTLTADRKWEKGFWSLRYRTFYDLYNDQDEVLDNAWNHYLDATVNWDLSPRLNLGLVESFVYSDSAEVFGTDGTLRQGDNTYYYNTVNGTVSSMISPTFRTDVSGRYQFLRYDDLGQSNREDYDTYAAGVTLRKQQTKSVSLFGELRLETQDYSGAGEVSEDGVYYPGSTESSRVIPDRGFDTYSIGGGWDQLYTPQLNSSIRGGYMLKDMSAANTDSETSPYAEALVSYAVSDATRFTLSAVYSLYQSSLLTFSSQDRASFALSLAHDLTAKISAYAGATYMNSQYSAQDSVDTISEASVTDGSEDAYSLYARLAYSLNRSNWLEAGFKTTDFTSDFQEEFTQNIFDIAWKTRL